MDKKNANCYWDTSLCHILLRICSFGCFFVFFLFFFIVIVARIFVERSPILSLNEINADEQLPTIIDSYHLCLYEYGGKQFC